MALTLAFAVKAEVSAARTGTPRIAALDEKRLCRFAWKAAVDAALLLLDSVDGSRHSASGRKRTVSAWKFFLGPPEARFRQDAIRLQLLQLDKTRWPRTKYESDDQMREVAERVSRAVKRAT
jgi:hypothetical protein